MPNCPKLFANTESLITLQRVLKQEFDLQVIAGMDAEELYNYVYEILNKYNIEIHRRNMSITYARMLIILTSRLNTLS